MDQKKEYRKLPGRFWFGFYSSTLWLGRDHVLAVYNKFFSEEYKRFYFKDIQRITVRKTNTAKVWMGIWAGLAFLVALFLLGGWSPFPVAMAVFFIILLVMNIWRGPTCWVHFQTAVQVEKIPALHRWKTAVKSLKRIRPLIEQVQGVLPETVTEQSLTERRHQEQESIAHSDRPGLLKHEGGHFHSMLFLLLLISGLMTLIDYHFNHTSITITEILIGIGVIIMTIVALVRQYQSDLTGEIKIVTWITLAYQGFAYVAGYVFFVLTLLNSKGIHRNQWDYLQMITDLSPSDSPFLKIMFIINIALDLLLGVGGLIVLYKRRGA